MRSASRPAQPVTEPAELQVPTCINCNETIKDENDPCYGHPDATAEWPKFHTPSW